MFLTSKSEMCQQMCSVNQIEIATILDFKILGSIIVLAIKSYRLL